MFLNFYYYCCYRIITIKKKLIFHGSEKPGAQRSYLASSLTAAQLPDHEDRWDGQQVGAGKEGNGGRGGTGSGSYGMVGSKGKGGWEEG